MLPGVHRGVGQQNVGKSTTDRARRIGDMILEREGRCGAQKNCTRKESCWSEVQMRKEGKRRTSGDISVAKEDGEF